MVNVPKNGRKIRQKKATAFQINAMEKTKFGNFKFL
jgi:hypothetical protein